LKKEIKTKAAREVPKKKLEEVEFTCGDPKDLEDFLNL